MKLDTHEITSVIQQEIERFSTELEVSQVGTVVEVGDGIARVYGLSTCMAGEMVEFQSKNHDGATVTIYGQAMNLEEDIVGIVIFGDYLLVKEGDQVRTTSTLLSVPVGEAMLGRVVNPLGQPLDGKGPIDAAEHRKVDIIAPGIAAR